MDKVVEIADIPQSSVGAPCPMILTGEGYLYLAYFLQDTPPDWDGKTVKVVGENTQDEPSALVKFVHPYAHMFGPPNDEAFTGHPLASRGLRPYSVSEVQNSSWIHKLERMNSVHHNHRPERFKEYHHYIFAFHDSTFECVAEGYKMTTHMSGVTQQLDRVFRDMISGNSHISS